MCVCVFVCIYIYICVCVCVYLYICMYVYKIHIYTCVYVHICTYVHICMCVCIYMQAEILHTFNRNDNWTSLPSSRAGCCQAWDPSGLHPLLFALAGCSTVNWYVSCML